MSGRGFQLQQRDWYKPSMEMRQKDLRCLRICDYTADDLRGGICFSAYVNSFQLPQLQRNQIAAIVALSEAFSLANTVRLRA